MTALFVSFVAVDFLLVALLSLGAALVTFDLTPFAGQTVRLRFAEVDIQG